MRRSHAANGNMPPDERLREVAGILAAGIVRLRVRAALPGANGDGVGREKTLENKPNWLEVPTEVRLTVHRG